MIYGIFIGLSKLDPVSYNSWEGILLAPLNDVARMNALIKVDKAWILVDGSATVMNVIETISEVSLKAESSDKVYIYYSGHGASVADNNKDENDGKDETWCLYDGMLLDDDLYKILTYFRTGVEIVLISDSCHSGTISKAVEKNLTLSYAKKYFKFGSNRQVKRPFIIEQSNKPNILTLSACQDFQYAFDGDPNSLFTEIMLNVYEMFPEYRNNYIDFIAQVREQMPNSQTPRLGYKNGRGILFTKVFE